MLWQPLLLLISLHSAAYWHDPHKYCQKRELARRDCHLKIRPFELQLSKLKLTWSNGTWTSISDAPMPGEGNEWEKVTLAKIAGRWILQMWIWDSGKGEAPVQSLHWIVGELDEHKFTARTDEIVRKRKLQAVRPNRYDFDGWIAHDLKAKGNVIFWKAGRKTGSF